MNNVKAISADLVVYFGNKRIENKDFLPLSLTHREPIFKYNFKSNKYYTFIIVDPDAPVGYWIHYCIYNITDKDKGVKYYIYSPPAPPPKTGPKKDGRHRYYCILYEQEEKIIGKKPILGRDFIDYLEFRNILGVSLESVAYVAFICKSGEY